MKLTIEQALQQGAAAHKEGKLQDAERLYRAILHSQPTHPDANHNLGVLSVSLDKADAALSLFETALKANPNIKQFWLSYINALIKTKKFDDAKQVIEEAKTHGVEAGRLNSLKAQILPKTQKSNTARVSPPQELLNSLLGHYQNRRFSDAETLALSITRDFPKHQFAWKVLGTVLGITGRNSEAQNAQRTAVTLSPQDAVAHYNLGNTLQKIGKLDEAEASYNQAIALNPDFAEARSNLGTTLQELGRLDDAEASYNKAIALKPNFFDAHYNLGVTLQELGRLDDAEASYNQALALRKGFAEAHYNLGNTLQKLGRLEEAEASYTQAIALKPDYAETHSNLGNTLKELGRLEEAEASYNEAIALQPDYTEARSNLGTTLQELGRLEEAEASYNKAIALKPDFAEARSNLGNALQELGRLDDAEASYNKAIALKPDFAEARSNLGNTLKELGRLKEAEAICRQAIALKPDFAKAHYNLGTTLYELGRLEEAEASFNQAIAVKPDFAEAHSNMGNTLKQLGRLEEAEASYRQAIALQPDYTEAHNNLGLMLQELGRLNEAMNIYHLMLTTKSEKVSIATVSPMIALLPFGRAGSMFFHSLFDGHPEVATLPGVYFKGWFGIDQWRRFAPDLSKVDWRENLIAKVVREYQPFFNASCKNNVAGKPFGNSKWLAKDQGFANMGPDQSQVFAVDQKSFSDAFLLLLKPFSSIGIQQCFELIHRAFEISARRAASASSQKNSNIFYHIHNPEPYEYAHFLKHYPQARVLHIIRNPLQSMESWMLTIHSADMENTGEKTKPDREHVQLIYCWIKMVKVVETMFLQLQSPFNTYAQSRGVRLEDVKRNAHDVMPKIAAWIGIPDHPAIYESSFCGFEYWGPSSKRTGKITGFDTKAIDLPTGRLFGSRDILIFETLFWPLSRQYGYTQLETADFRRQLIEIRPWLDEPLEFEKQLYDQLFEHNFALEKLIPYIRLHKLLSRLWETLHRDGTYCNMVKPLELAD